MSQAVWQPQGTGVGERLLTQRDRRADGGARHVRVTRGDILIARRFGGVEMMIAAPVEAYRGVSLVDATDASGEILYRVMLVHRDADLDIFLGDFRDRAEGLAAWSDWAAWFDLTRLAMRNGEWVSVEAPTGKRSIAMRRPRTSIARRRVCLPPRRMIDDTLRLAGILTTQREIAGHE